MSDEERTQLIATMGHSIAKIDLAIRERDQYTASLAFIQFMGAAGFVAQEIDELDRPVAN